jgi:hypothetical protein
LCGLPYDLLLCIWCPCFLAHITLLLDCSVCPHNEAPNHAHDQVQICSIQQRKAGMSFGEFYSNHPAPTLSYFTLFYVLFLWW